MLSSLVQNQHVLSWSCLLTCNGETWCFNHYLNNVGGKGMWRQRGWFSLKSPAGRSLWRGITQSACAPAYMRKGSSNSLQREWILRNGTLCPKPLPGQWHIWFLGCHYVTVSHLPILGKYCCCWFVCLRAFSLQLCSLPFPRSSVPSHPGCWDNVFRVPGAVFAPHCSCAVVLMLLSL